jgi:hypothetical protein
MILDSAEIAGLSVLNLVHENTAAATMFGIDRMDREKPVNVLFYNMGAMDTEVSLQPSLSNLQIKLMNILRFSERLGTLILVVLI